MLSPWHAEAGGGSDHVLGAHQGSGAEWDAQGGVDQGHGPAAGHLLTVDHAVAQLGLPLVGGYSDMVFD